jgi:hypothetical protein
MLLSIICMARRPAELGPFGHQARTLGEQVGALVGALNGIADHMDSLNYPR